MLIECVLGDLTQQPDIDVIVNSAHPTLRPGSGVSGAIHRAAGPKLAQAAERLGPIALGQAVITPGFNLPNPYVIHTRAPRYRDEPEPSTYLAVAIRTCLYLADQHMLTGIAFPALGTGIFAFPLEEAAPLSLETSFAVAPELVHLKKIRWVLHTPQALACFAAERARLLPGPR